MIQLASSLLMSSNLPGAGRAMTAMSSDSSPLKSPTIKLWLPDWAMRSLPKTRWKAAVTSACVGGGSLGAGVAAAAGEGCGVAAEMGFSTRAAFFDLALHPGNPKKMNTDKARVPLIKKKNLMRFMAKVPGVKAGEP